MATPDDIHHASTIQSFGFLIATDRSVDRITHASANIAEFTNVDPASLVGEPLADALPSETVHAVRNVAGHSTIRSKRSFVCSTTVAATPQLFDLHAHATDDHLILEFQPAPVRTSHAPPVMANVQQLLASATENPDIGDMLHHLVAELRSLTGYERVVAYRFLQRNSGEVVAESKTPTQPSIMGVRFSGVNVANAIHSEVFQRDASLPIRVVSGANATQHAVLTAPGVPDLDLSLAVLRGVTPEHTDFLRLLGVNATMALPIVTDATAWGLLLFSHTKDRSPDASTAMACTLICQSASMRIEQLTRRDLSSRMEQCRALVSSHLLADDNPLGYSSYWGTAAPDYASLIECDGIAMVGLERIDTYGACPDDAAIRALLTSVELSEDPTTGDHRVVTFEQFSKELPTIDFGPAAGALLILEPLATVDALIFFRGRLDTKLAMGDAAKTPVASSADRYLELAAARCEPWSSDDYETTFALQAAYLTASTSQRANRQQRERLGLLVRELNHRVRNILALVHSLIGQTQIEATSIEEYATALRDRVDALARVHDLFTDNDWGPANITDFFNRALRPFLTRSSQQLNLHGPDILIPSDLANLLALVMHELASNATKYGALRTTGEVDLQWALESDNVLTIGWIERDGPTVQPPSRQGFGTSIIRKALVFEFDAEADLTFHAAGVQAHLRIPISANQSSLRARASPSAPALNENNAMPLAPAPQAEAETDVLNVLIVEDDFLIATQTAAAIEQSQNATCIVTPSVPRALAAVETHAIDVAFLDVNLRGEFSGPVATRLTELEIPFVFVTGYGSQDHELQSFAYRQIFTKPVSPAQLLQVIEDVTGSAPSAG